MNNLLDQMAPLIDQSAIIQEYFASRIHAEQSDAIRTSMFADLECVILVREVRRIIEPFSSSCVYKLRIADVIFIVECSYMIENHISMLLQKKATLPYSSKKMLEDLLSILGQFQVCLSYLKSRAASYENETSW